MVIRLCLKYIPVNYSSRTTVLHYHKYCRNQYISFPQINNYFFNCQSSHTTFAIQRTHLVNRKIKLPNLQKLICMTSRYPSRWDVCKWSKWQYKHHNSMQPYTVGMAKVSIAWHFLLSGAPLQNYNIHLESDTMQLVLIQGVYAHVYSSCKTQKRGANVSRLPHFDQTHS